MQTSTKELPRLDWLVAISVGDSQPTVGGPVPRQMGSSGVYVSQSEPALSLFNVLLVRVHYHSSSVKLKYHVHHNMCEFC